MLFNSYEYIFAFLPLTIIGFLLVGQRSRTPALTWIILASVVYYAWWRPLNVLIIAPSLIINYLCARALLQLAGDESRRRTKLLVLTLGVIWNLGFLGFFKYANFVTIVANDLSGSDFILEQIILPLGISFITFQKITFLIDVAGRRIKSFTFNEFMLFIMFFPQLIAGPMVHFNETMPQFRRTDCRFHAETYALALTLFCFGLFKKVVLADGIAEYVTPVYGFAADGGSVTFLLAWLAAVGFTLQIYFDFSGYSDMACGAALFFGVRLPLNFDSPLKCSNIIDFWLRWHVTLTRFLTAYVYNPIALTLTRRRAAKRQPMLKSHDSHLGAFLFVLACPTIFTMFLSGLWHGAGYTFIIWGLLHGFFIVVNHIWGQYGPRLTQSSVFRTQLATFFGFLLTFLVVVFAMVIFRAPDLTSAVVIFKGMLGLNGLSLPPIFAQLLSMPDLAPMVWLYGEVHPRTFAFGAATLGGMLGIALLLPNTLQILSRYNPVLEGPRRPPRLGNVGPEVHWRPTLPWMILVAILGMASMMRLYGKSEFLSKSSCSVPDWPRPKCPTQ